jgi:hypothetical protein
MEGTVAREKEVVFPYCVPIARANAVIWGDQDKDGKNKKIMP